MTRLILESGDYYLERNFVILRGMVRGRKAPNILRCTRTEWMAAWEDAVRRRPRLIIIIEGDHNKNMMDYKTITIQGGR